MVLFRAVIADRVFISQNLNLIDSKDFHCFSTKGVLEYEPLCDDFGPMKLSHVMQFIELLDAELAANSEKRIVYLVDTNRRELANAIFLLGSYMMLKEELSAGAVSSRFDWLDPSDIELFRDATFQ